jgi:hypothetical protein
MRPEESGLTIALGFGLIIGLLSAPYLIWRDWREGWGPLRHFGWGSRALRAGCCMYWLGRWRSTSSTTPMTSGPHDNN